MKKTITILSLALITINGFSQIPSWIPNPGAAATLQAYYGFNGNTNDLTSNGLNLSNAGASLTTDRFNVANSAYSFDGAVNYMSKPGFPANTVGLFAISAWIKRSSTSVNGIIAQKGEYTSLSNTSSGALIVGPTEMESRMYIGAAPYSAASTGAGNGTDWYHLVLDYDGSGLYCFINGSLNGYLAGTTSPNNAVSDLTIGAWKIDGVLSQYFSGKIDDIAIYNGPLTTCEIRDMYNSCVLTQPTPQTAAVGSTATFELTNNCYSSASITYQWQADNGGGYTNLTNAGQFSGVTTNSLSVANVTMSNNNTLYKCIISNGAGCSKTTAPVALTVTSTTGINEYQNNLSFTIAPNPFTSETTIDFNNEQKNTHITIVDILGNKVRSQYFSGKLFTIEKGELSNGIYFVQVTDEQKNTSNKKIIIQ